MHHIIAVDIGGTRFRAGLFDQTGKCLEVVEGDTSRAGGRDWMLAQVKSRCGELARRAENSVKAIGVSFGGPVDFERQCVNSLHVSGWANFALSQWTRETLKMPCRVDNDANAGALGEFRFGAGRGTRSLFYVTLSTGIGGGLVVEGKVQHGRDSMAGEIGHIPVSDSDVACACGAKGCLEAFCSGTAIAQRGREWAARRSESATRLVELSGGNPNQISSEAVFKAAAEGDPISVEIVHETAQWLARGLLTVIRIVNPDKIILGGGVSRAGDVLLKPIRKAVGHLASPSLPTSTEIVLAELENYSPLYGAATLALEVVENRS